MHVTRLIICRGAVLLASFVASGTVLGQADGATMKMNCAAVLDRMRTDVAKDPGRLVLAVEDALTTSESCSCVIIRTAVDLTGRDPALFSQILIAAIRVLPASAAELTACVLLEAPEAETVLRAALARELGDRAPGLLTDRPRPHQADNAAHPDAVANETGKSPVEIISPVPAPVGENDLSIYPVVGVSGIYFIPTARAIARGSRGLLHPAIPRNVLTTIRNTPRPSGSPVTSSAPQ